MILHLTLSTTLSVKRTHSDRETFCSFTMTCVKVDMMLRTLTRKKNSIPAEQCIPVPILRPPAPGYTFSIRPPSVRVFANNLRTQRPTSLMKKNHLRPRIGGLFSATQSVNAACLVNQWKSRSLKMSCPLVSKRVNLLLSLLRVVLEIGKC